MRERAGEEPAADLATVLARRILAIDPDDPGRPRKAFRVFLESVLLAEFGSELINDAGFHQLVEEVHLQMETDSDLGSGHPGRKFAIAGTRRSFEARLSARGQTPPKNHPGTPAYYLPRKEIGGCAVAPSPRSLVSSGSES